MLKQLSSLNNLRTFVLAAEHLSFKAAAKLLNISPTAVSHQIKSLEEQLRVNLFIRHTRAISLTLEGQQLVSSCRNSFNVIENCIELISHNKNEVTVSCCNSFTALWITPKSQQINQLLNGGQLKICASDSLIDFNRDKHIDLAIRYGVDNNDPNEHFLCTETINLYKSSNLKIDHLSKPQLFVTKWAENGLLPNIRWGNMIDKGQYIITTYEQEYFVLQAIITGQGYGLLSNVLANSALEQGWIEPVASFSPQNGYGYWLRTNQERSANHMVRKLKDWIKINLE